MVFNLRSVCLVGVIGEGYSFLLSLYAVCGKLSECVYEVGASDLFVGLSWESMRAKKM